MTRTGRMILLIAAIVVMVIGDGVLASCNSPSSTEAQTNKVTVTLTDMHIDSSQTTFKAGVAYEFVVTNKGAINHELMIVKPMAPGTMSMEDMDRMAVADIEAEALPTGTTQILTVIFPKAYPSGSLELACHLEGHYEAGMHQAITVDPSS